MSSTLKAALATVGVLFVIMAAVLWVLDDDSAPNYSRLETALSLAPDASADVPFTTQPIEFADYAGSREAAGLEEAVGFEAYVSLPVDARGSLYRELPRPGNYLLPLYEKLAIDLYGFDLGIWVIQPDPRFRNFMVLQGAFDRDQIVEKLMGLGYQESEHNRVPYFWLFEEAKADLRHPLRLMSLQVNRVAFVDDKLLLGSDDFVIESLIDVQLGRVPSLRDNRRFVRLARASGQGVSGGVLLDYRWLEDTWRRLPDLQFPKQYLEVPGTWGTLAAYQLVLLGYRQTGGSGETVVALIHPQISSGKRNATELEKRWNSFYAQTSWEGGPVVDDAVRMGGNQWGPITDLCSPISTSVIERIDKRQPPVVGLVALDSREYSVLNGTCPIIEGERPDPATPGPGLWRTLYETRQLAFLVSGPTE